MLISCKCLNFIASSSSQQQHHLKPNSSAAVVTNDASHPAVRLAVTIDDDCSMSSNGSGTSNASAGASSLAMAMMHAFLQKHPRTFPFYSQCMEFFKQSIGPISDLTINAINQRDLIYSLTLEIQLPNNNVALSNQSPQSQAWQISICINCNTALCAKRLGGSPQTSDNAVDGHQPIHQNQQLQQQYLLNCSLLTNNDELMHRRSDKSFSETFGLLIMDHPQLENGQNPQQLKNATSVAGHNLKIGSFSIGAVSLYQLDPKHQRLNHLHNNLQVRLQKEIVETDERIQRYTEQQFALLKSFREKSEREFQLLANLIQRVPEQCELLDRTPPALDVNGGSIGMGVGSYAQRRRNTIGSHRDLKANMPTAHPTTLKLLSPNFGTSKQNVVSISSNNAIDTKQNQAKIEYAQTQINQQPGDGGSGAFSSINQRKMTHFDTPPATPEATPMSVGNSPTFRQQQQNITLFGGRLATSNSFQQQFPTPTIEAADDCLFELEGVDGSSNNNTVCTTVGGFHHHQHHFTMTQNSNFHRNHNEMSDVDESDSAEEAEDALGLDSSMAIPMHNARRRQASTNQMMSFGKSLPIQIANSPLAERLIADDYEEDELDNTVDIAASIKALAKSVHGEAVFGDLPRPRLRSQI